MIQKLLRWFEPPKFPEDEEKNRQAHFVNTLGMYFFLMLISGALIFVPIFAAHKILSWSLIAVLIGVYIYSRRLLHKGQITISSFMIVIGAWVVFQGVATFTGGINSPAVFAIVAVICLIVMLMQKRLALIILLSSLLIGLVQAALQSVQIKVPTIFTFSPLATWTWLALILGFVYSAINVMVGDLQKALHFASQKRAELQDAEITLRRSEARLLQAQNLAQVGIWEWDFTTDTTIWSDEMLRIYGITREEFSGKGEDYLNFTHPEDRAAQRENIRRDFEIAGQHASSSGDLVYSRPDPKEFRIIRKDGSICWVRGDAVEVVDEHGNPLRMHGILWDITEQKLAQEKILESEKRYRDLFENIPIGLYRSTPGGQMLDCNPAMAEMFGYARREDILEQGALKLWADPEQRAVLLAPAALKNTYDFEAEMLRKDGSTFWARNIARVMRNQQGQILFYEGSIHDISERKKAAEEIIKLKLGVEHSTDAIFVTDPSGVITYVNQAFEKVYGFNEAEVLGNTPRIIKSGLASPETYQTFWQNLLDRKAVEGPIVNKTKDGRLLAVEGSNNPILDGSGKIIGFMGIHRDITERKHAEEQIQQSEKKYRELFEVNNDGISIFVLSPDMKTKTFVEVNEAAHKMLGYTREEMLSLSPEQLEPNATMEELAARQNDLQKHGVAKFETILTHKDGHKIYAEFATQLITFEGQPAIMNIVHDATDRKQRELELKAISKLSAALRAAPSRAAMLPVIVDQLSQLVNCAAISIEIIDPTTRETVVEAAHGPWLALIGTRQAPGTGLNEVIYKTRIPYHDNNIKDDSRIGIPRYLIENIKAGAGVPLIAQDVLIGYLWLGSQVNIAEEDVQMLSSVADIAANAIHRATLHEQTKFDAAELARTYDTTLEGWAHALELRDQETEGHSQRVTQMTLQMARAFEIGEADLVHLRRGAILHDIGKMGIPDSILHKPGPLTEEEWEIMRRHPQYAYDLLASIEHLRPALDIPYCHHEKFDGTGYPRGLKGAQIPLSARIFAVVDVWDALRSNRPYRQGWPEDKVLDFIRSQSGTHFDPQVVEIFLKTIH